MDTFLLIPHKDSILAFCNWMVYLSQFKGYDRLIFRDVYQRLKQVGNDEQPYIIFRVERLGEYDVRMGTKLPIPPNNPYAWYPSGPEYVVDLFPDIFDADQRRLEQDRGNRNDACINLVLQALGNPNQITDEEAKRMADAELIAIQERQGHNPIRKRPVFQVVGQMNPFYSRPLPI